MKKQLLFILSWIICIHFSWAQNFEITGTVQDKEKIPLSGVSIYIKDNLQIATISNYDGHFTLKVPSSKSIVVFSFVGMINQELPASSLNKATITLKDQTVNLEETVVVGYGTQKKVNLTGSVANVDVKKTFESRPVNNVAKALQGVSPGLIVTQSNGNIGSNPSIKIRGGAGSLNGSSSPLILVDNVEITDISIVNPDDIENISVLKDAASSSIYGARGAFGVILITTKKGRSSKKVNISFSSNYALSKPTYLPTVASSVNGATATLLAQERINGKSSTNIIGMNLDWEAVDKMKNWVEQYGNQNLSSEMVLGRDFEKRDGKWFYYRPWNPVGLFVKNYTPSNINNLNLSGGNEQIKYSLSLGATNQSGILKEKTDEYSRYNASTNLSMNITSNILIRFKSMLSKSQREKPYSFNGVTYDDWYYLLRWPSYYPYGTYQGKGFRSTITNNRNANMNTSTNLFSRTGLGSTINFSKHLEGLKWDFDYVFSENNGHTINRGGWAEGYNFWNGDGIDLFNTYSSQSMNEIEYWSSWSNRHNIKSFLTYEKVINDNHNLKVIVGVDNEQYEYWRHATEFKNLIDRTRPELGLATGEFIDNRSTNDRTQWATNGFFGRINYNYKGKYLAEVNGRYDGSSRFPKSGRYSYFPSLSLGYRISEESFMDNIKPTLSDLKFRVSWGSIGNQDVGNNTFVSQMSLWQSGWIIGGTNLPTLTNPTIVPPELTWERVTSTDFGIDAKVLSNTLTLTFDWYKRVTSDMITSGESLPPTFGATVPQINNGELTTTGVELGANYNISLGKNLILHAGASFFNYKSVITKYDKNAININANYEGKVLGEIWGYKTDRLFQAEDFSSDGKLTPNENIPSQSKLESNWFVFGPGDIKYKDIDGNSIIDYGTNTINDHGDLTVIGNTTPKFQYSFSLGADWKGLDLNVFFQGVGSRSYWADGPIFIPGYRYNEAWYTHQMDYWTELNTDAFYPRPTSTQSNNQYNFLKQDRYLMNMSYLRCKNLTLGYVLPKSITNKVHINKFRLYISAENLFEITNLNVPIDPETGETASSFGFGRSYPFSRVISMGLQINL